MSSEPGIRPSVRFDALTSLRFFAAIHVVLFHCHKTLAPFLNSNHERFPRLIDWLYTAILRGPWAVAFFFVLSGFVLAHGYAKRITEGKTSAREFWIARIARIYPVYLVGLLLMAPLVIKAVHSGILTTGSTVAGFFASLFLVQSWYSAPLSWNMPGWSVSDEWFFYLSFPLIAPMIYRIVDSKKLLAIFVFFIAAAGFAMSGWLEMVGLKIAGWSKSPDWFYDFVSYHPVVRLAEFIAGIALYQFASGKGFTSGSRLAGWIMLAILTVLVGMDFGENGNAILGFFMPLVFAMTILFVARSGHASKLMSHPWLVYLGEASYAMYILHFPLLSWLRWLTRLIKIESIGPFDGAGLVPVLIYVGVVMIVSCLMFHFFERPAKDALRDRLRDWIGDKPAPVPSTLPK